MYTACIPFAEYLAIQASSGMGMVSHHSMVITKNVQVVLTLANKQPLVLIVYELLSDFGKTVGYECLYIVSTERVIQNKMC